MTVLIVTGIAIGIVMAVFYARSKHPVQSALKGMLSGAAVFLLVYYLGGNFNVHLPLSFFNTGVSLLLGVPGVILLVVGNFVLV